MTTAVDKAASVDAPPSGDRLLDGLADSIGERGYRATTVADVVRNAKTSKRTFYDEFASKEECFVELLRSEQRGPDRPHHGGGRSRRRDGDQVRAAAGPTSTTSSRGPPSR